MRHGSFRMLAGGALAALVLAACGGSGNRTAGIDSTGRTTTIAIGTVSAFGSVVVNGVHYETNSATFTIDGRPGTQSDLAVGDVVVVKAELASGATTGTASTVTFDDVVEGPIASIDSAASTFTVLGQLVRVGAETSFDDSFQPPSFAALVVGAVVEVSGLVQSDGSISATRIEPKPAGGELELTGVVSSLDSVARRFNINALVVDYSTALLQNFPAGGVANGQLVEVKGATIAAGGALVATRVEFEGDGHGGAAGDRLEVEGFITRFASATDFDVGGVPVATNGQTQFEGGVAADLGLNIKVEAEGTLGSNGVLVASKIDVRRGSAVRIAARVDSVGAGSVVVLGITVRSDSLTRSEDKSALGLSPFGIGNLNIGDYVEVRGAEVPPGSGEVLASFLERLDPGSDVELQGFVEAVTQPSFEILDVTVTTDGGTQFSDVNDASISASEFFSTVAPGTLVKASGTEVADTAIQADEAELED